MKGLRLSLFLSLPPSPFLLPSPISLKMEEKEEEEKCTLLKHEWITKSRVHSFAPYRPRNPQKVYLSPRATMAYTLARRRPTFLPSLLTPRPRGIVIGVLLNRYVQETIERERELSVALVEAVSRKRPILLVRSFVDDFKWQETKKILPVSSSSFTRIRLDYVVAPSALFVASSTIFLPQFYDGAWSNERIIS